jgi:hypothetical protein
MAHDLSKGLKRRGKIGFLDRKNGPSGTKYGPNSPFVPRNNSKLLAEYFENESTAGDGSRLLDTSRFGTRRTGQQGRCYTADGTDDEVNYGDIGTAIWFSGWVKLNSDNQCLFSLSNNTNTNVIVAAGVLTAGATLTLSGIKVDNVTKNATEAGALLNDNLYHFLSCGIGDGLGGGSTANNVRFFTDGTNHGSVSGFDWRFYSTTPTADELTEAYSGRGARNIAAMSKYALWDKMDTQSGVASYDSSGNGLTGALTNITAANFHATQDIYSFQNQVGYNRPIDRSSTVGGVAMSYPFAAQPASSYEISYWVKCENYAAASVFLLSWDNVNGLGHYFQGSGVLRAKHIAVNLPTTKSYADGLWHRVLVTWNGSTLTLQVDSETVSTACVGSISSANLLNALYSLGATTTHISNLKVIIDGQTIFDSKQGDPSIDLSGNGNSATGLGGSVLGSGIDVYTPRDESDSTNDVLGNPLTYTSTRPNDGALINSSCLTADGTLYIAAAHLAGTETVVRSGGTSTPSISAGRIDFTAGTCWDLLLSDGTYYPLADCWGTPISNAAADGDDGVLTNATLASAWGATQDDFHYNTLNGFSLYEHASTAAIRAPFVNGSARSFTPPTGYTLTAHYPAGSHLIPAETEINFNPDSTPEMENVYTESVFNGTTSHGYVTNNSVLNFTDYLTVSCWAKSDLSDVTSNSDVLVSMYESTGSLQVWRMEITTGEFFRFMIGNSGGTGMTNETADVAKPIDSWNHYAATFESGTVKLYINGELQSSSSSSSHAAVLNGRSAPLLIGAFNWSAGGGGQQEWDGSIRNIRVYRGDSSGLSNSQILRDMMESESQPQFDSQTVITSYDLVKDTIDRSGNNLHATNNGITFTQKTLPSTYSFGDYLGDDSIINKTIKFDKVGWGATFDGSSYVNIGNRDKLRITTEPFEIEAEIKLTGTGAYDIFSKYQTASNKRCYRFYVSNGDLFFTTTDNGSTTATLIGSVSVNDGGWHRVKVVRETASSTSAKIYIDGVEDAGVAGSIDSSIYDANSVASIGAYNLDATPAGEFEGNIRDVRVTVNGVIVGEWELSKDAKDGSANDYHGTNTGVTFNSPDSEYSMNIYSQPPFGKNSQFSKKYNKSRFAPSYIPYVLDRIGGVVGCWSTRQLMSTGSGNIIRGRDATTNEQDFTGAGYPAGVVTLASGGDAFTPQLYDQSGNANHATQAVAASQPKLVDTGSLIVDASGRPVMEFGGSQSFTITKDLNIESLVLRIKTSDLTYIIGDSVGDGSTFMLAASQGSPSVLYRNSGSLSYYVNGVSQSWANRGDAYTTLSAGIFLTLVITGLDLSLYAAQISFFGYAGFQFSGQIALMAAFDKNLTQSEITQLHNALA